MKKWPGILTAGTIVLAACTQFPELDEAATPGVAEAPYPDLVPLDTLLTGPDEIRAVPETVPEVEARVDLLRAKADRLMGARVSQSAAVPTRLARLRQKAEDLRAQ